MDIRHRLIIINVYNAIVVIGGPGSKLLVGNEKLDKILLDARDRNLLITAICYAPIILARIGLLKGKKATVWNEDGMQSPIFEEEGVHFVNEIVVVDGNIVTGNGPGAATEFAKTIIRVLEEK